MLKHYTLENTEFRDRPYNKTNKMLNNGRVINGHHMSAKLSLITLNIRPFFFVGIDASVMGNFMTIAFYMMEVTFGSNRAPRIYASRVRSFEFPHTSDSCAGELSAAIHAFYMLIKYIPEDADKLRNTTIIIVYDRQDVFDLIVTQMGRPIKKNHSCKKIITRARSVYLHLLYQARKYEVNIIWQWQKAHIKDTGTHMWTVQNKADSMAWSHCKGMLVRYDLPTVAKYDVPVGIDFIPL